MAKTVSWIFGIIFVIAGIAGFFMNPALGFIAADKLSSIIHLIVGIVLIIMAGKPSAAMTLKVVGVIYVLWSILGFAGWSFTAINGPTTWFYLIVGVVLFVLGWTSKGKMSSGGSMNMPAGGSAPQM